MSNDEVVALAFGGAKTTATVIRLFALVALLGGLGSAVFAITDQDDVALGLYLGATGLLAAALLDASAWGIDLLRGILAGVWHSAWQLDEEEVEDDEG